MIDLQLEIEKLSPQEGDIIVIKSKDILGEEQLDKLKEALYSVVSKYDYHVEGIILIGNKTINKISQEELKKLIYP